MKLISPSIYKQLIPLSLFAIVSLFVWFDGPLIHIHGYTPLQDPEKRIDLIGLFFLWWLLNSFFFNPPTGKASTDTLDDREIKKKLKYLEGRFKGAIQFLKNTVISKNGKKIRLDRLPWYLVMGPANAGKTTLLSNSTVNYILVKQPKEENLKTVPSDVCHWWVTRDVVLVEVPGSYLSMVGLSFLWQRFLGLLRCIRNENKLRGVIVTLHAPELMHQQNSHHKNKIAADLKKRVTEILETFGSSMPIHFVITKCDLLPGFSEFFDESTSDEIAQSWGVVLPTCANNENLLDVFVQQFNELIHSVNKQLIWRLHHERDRDARSSIKDFPFHVERLKEFIVQLLKDIAIPHLPLSSVYLTSGTQNPTTELTTGLSSSTKALVEQPSSITSLPGIPSKAYFIKQFILHHLLAMPAQPDVVVQGNTLWRRRGIYTTAISAVLIVSLLLGRDFQRSVQQTYALQNNLAQYQVNIQKLEGKSDRLTLILPLLNALRQAANTEVNQLSLTFYLDKSKKTAQSVYRQALQTIVLPEIKHSFEKYLQMANTKNPEQVYTVLKAYLMLNDAARFQPYLIADLLQQLVPNAGDKISIAALADHVHAALLTGSVPVKLDNPLIAAVRKQLFNLSGPALAFVILKNMGGNNTDDAIDMGTVLGNPPVLVSKAVATLIPAMFTAKAFDDIVSSEIDIAASEALRGNWVLGNHPIMIDQMSVDALAAQLRTQYIANYIDIWESLLANIQLRTPQNLAQLDKMIVMLTGNNSPLLRLLDTIKINTAITPITTASPKLQNLSVLLMNANRDQPNGLYGIFISLQELHSYLEGVLKASAMGVPLFQAAQDMKKLNEDPIAHIRSIAEQSPEPMKTWLNTIAMQSAQFVA